MKKKLIILCLFALLTVSACGAQERTSEQAKPPATMTPVQETAMPAYEKLYIQLGDLRIGIFDDANIVLSALPPPIGTFEAESCAYQGMDSFYYYDGFQLMVNEIDGARQVTSIGIKDDLFKTPQGVRFGLSRARVKELMAPLDLEMIEDGDILQYIDCKTVLKLRFDLDKLVAAEYTPYKAE
jgi:hypothetical protein